ncbi:MAG: hypothetical protein ACLSB9_33080 [Hydrogeniiclostridium mannosilyticum]
MGGPWLGLQLTRQGYHLDMGCPLRKPVCGASGNLSNRSSSDTGSGWQEQNSSIILRRIKTWPLLIRNGLIPRTTWLRSSRRCRKPILRATGLPIPYAFAANGFVDQKDGSTAAYAHFVQFGASEDVAPNAYFNANEYYYARLPNILASKRLVPRRLPL